MQNIGLVLPALFSSVQIAGKYSPETARKLGGYTVIFRSGQTGSCKPLHEGMYPIEIICLYT